MSTSKKYKKTVRPIVLGGRSLSYECTRKKMKNVTVRIREGKVLVSSPTYVSFARIEEILREKQDFILRAIDASLAREAAKQNAFLCEDGACVSLMGEEYTLRFAGRGTSRTESGEMILVLKKTEDEDKRREALKRFAEKRLRAYAEEAFGRVSPLFPGAPSTPGLKLRVMCARWGSCRPKTGVITLNTRLAFYPTAYVDYVIMHEFTHFLYADHSKAFWAALAERMPDWEERRKALNAEPMKEWV